MSSAFVESGNTDGPHTNRHLITEGLDSRVCDQVHEALSGALGILTFTDIRLFMLPGEDGSMFTHYIAPKAKEGFVALSHHMNDILKGWTLSLREDVLKDEGTKSQKLQQALPQPDDFYSPFDDFLTGHDGDVSQRGDYLEAFRMFFVARSHLSHVRLVRLVDIDAKRYAGYSFSDIPHQRGTSLNADWLFSTISDAKRLSDALQSGGVDLSADDARRLLATTQLLAVEDNIISGGKGIHVSY